MLFNSYAFVLLFLPVTVAAAFWISGKGHREHVLWLVVVASLLFYGFWNPAYVLLLLGSICANYVTGERLAAWHGQQANARKAKSLMVLGVAANLAAICYFKYANFFLENLDCLTGNRITFEEVILPLAISFFTFQQIAYLVDAYRGQTSRATLLEYSLFVTFFPQLIAGPIVHHSEVLGQYRSKIFGRFNHEAVAIGLTIFFLGLFKKVVLADGLAPYADAGFDAAARGEVLTFFEAWGATLGYTFQLYFDFSGYSDMAVGLARMFGVRLPLNFLSPYKADSVIDFWRRWHVTLSRFLREYLYFLLGGNRKGVVRRYANLVVVMVLGGLWHGAGWTFVAWGLLHGCYLMVNHAWRAVRQSLGCGGSPGLIGRLTARSITFLAVAAAWALFRADDMSAGANMLQALSGFHGFALPETYRGYLDSVVPLGHLLGLVGMEFRPTPYFQGVNHILWIVVSLVIVMALPNVSDFVAGASVGLRGTSRATTREPSLAWQPSPLWAAVVVVVMVWSIVEMNEVNEFLYYQF